MNARSSLIAVLLATNLASFGYITWQNKQQPTTTSAAVSKPAAVTVKSLIDVKLEEAVVQRDATGLRDLLRNAHYPEDTVEKMVSMLIWGAHDKRRDEIYRKTSEEKWWAPYDVTIAEPTAAELAELTLLEKKALAEEVRVFQKVSEDRMPFEYQFLSPEKQLAVAQLDADYSELLTKISIEEGDFTTLADDEKRMLLTKEQEADIRALLSPAEQRTRELRRVGNLGILNEVIPRNQLTEAEFIQIFDLQKSFDEKYPDPYVSEKPKTEAEIANAENRRKDRSEAEALFNKEVIAMLGEARVAEQRLKEDPDYRLAEGATRRFSLPADTPKRLLEIRDQTLAESQRIYKDASLNNEAKTKQIEALGNASAARVKTLIGDEAAQTIAADDRGNLIWLTAAQSGRVSIVDRNGRIWDSHAVTDTPNEDPNQ